MRAWNAAAAASVSSRVESGFTAKPQPRSRSRYPACVSAGAALAAPIDYAGELTHVVVSPFRPQLQSANVRWLPSDPLTTNRKVGHLTYALAAFPRELVVGIAGLALLGTIAGALAAALKDEHHRDPAILTFLVCLSGIKLLGIGAAFWGVVAGGLALVLLRFKRPL